MNRIRLIRLMPAVALSAAFVAGCARDGSLEPRGGSIKDSIAPPVAQAPPKARVASRPAPPKQRVTRLQTPKDEPSPPPARQAQPATPPSPPPPATTAAPPVLQPSLPAPSTSPAVRRPPANGPQLLEEGRSLFRAGEVLAARERYVAALNAPLPEVLLELARTYDPNYLDRLPKSDADADLDRARALYEQAVTLGSKPAEADLARLQGRPAQPR